MPQGLQIFDENGVLILDSSTRMARVCGMVGGTLSTPTSGTVEIEQKYFVNNAVFYLLTETAVLDTKLASALSIADINIDGRKIVYSDLPCNMIYGVF